MSDPFQMVAVMILSVIGPLAAWLGWRSRAIVRRLDAVPTSTVRGLAAGLAEVAGTLRAEREPLRTLSGDLALAARTRLSCTYVNNGRINRSLALVDVVDAVPIVLEDATGSCVLAVDPALVLGMERRFDLTVEVLEAARPELLARLQYGLVSGRVTKIHVEQTWVPQGATGFVSGRAVVDEVVPEEGYRDAMARFSMHGDEESPLIVSSWPERRVRRHVAMPSLRLYWVAAASAYVVIAILVAGAVMKAIGGVP
jgi:hypothetical protein